MERKRDERRTTQAETDGPVALPQKTAATKTAIGMPLVRLGNRSATTPAMTGPSHEPSAPWKNRVAQIDAKLGARA